MKRAVSPSTHSHRLFRWTVRLCACLIVVVSCLLVALHLPAGRRFVLSRVATVLEAREIRFSAERLSFNVFDLTLSLRDVSVGSPQSEPSPPVAVIERLDADISLLDLVRRRYVLQSGTAQGVTLHYVVEADGTNNMPGRAPDPESPGQPLDFLIDDFSIVNATLHYEDRARQIDAVLPVDEITVDGNRLTGRHAATVRAHRARIHTRQREWQIGRLSAALDLGDDDVVGKVALEAEGSRAEIEAAYHIARGQIEANEVRLSGDWGRMTAAGVVSTKGGPSSAVLMTDDVDLARLMALAGISPVVASRLNGQADAQWPGLDYTAASGRAELTLTPTATRPSGSTLPVGGHIVVSGNDGHLDAQISNAHALGVWFRGHFSLADHTRLSGTFRAEAGDLKATTGMASALLENTAVSALAIYGRAIATGVVDGTVTDPTVRASVHIPDVRVAGARDISARGDVGYRGNVIAVHSVDAAWGAARAQASGLVPLDGRPLAVTFQGNGFDVPSFLAAAGEDDVQAEGTFSLSGEVHGTLSEPAATASLHGAGIALLAEPLGELTARVDTTPSQITLHELVLDKPQESGNGRLAASGRYVLATRGYDLEVQTESIAITRMTLPDGRALRGNIELSAAGSGTLDRPGGTIELAASDLRLADHDLGAIRADASIANAQADVKVSADRFATHLDATIDTSAPYNATIEARIDGLDLAALPITIDTALAGHVSARLEGEGPLTAVRLARASAEVDALEGAWNGQPFSVEAPALVRYDSGRVLIERLRLLARGSTLAVSGAWPVFPVASDDGDDGLVEVEARFDLATLAQYAPAGVELSADGTLHLDGTIRGSLAAIDPDLGVTIDNGLVLGPAIDPGISDLDLRARITGGVATVEHFAGRWGAATIEAAARVPLSMVPGIPDVLPKATGPSTLTASLVGLSPAAIPGAPAGLSGRVSADVSASSERPEPAAVEGYLTFTELQVGLQGLELAQQQPSALTLESGTVRIDSFDLSGTAGALRAAGTVGLLGTQPLDVTVNSALETAAATSSLTDALRVEGFAWLNVAATGTVTDPRVDGSLVVSDVMVAIDEPEITAERLAAGAEFAGDRITLSYLSAEVNGGTVVASGGLTIGGGDIRGVDFSLGAEEFAFDAPLDLRSLSASQLRLTGQQDDLRLAGTVMIKEAGLTGDINFDTGLLATIAAPRSLDLTEERNPWLESLAFDVRVETETPILVDNNLARAEVTTDLRVVGTPYETGLSGSLTVLEGGEITLNERRYEIERGTVTFLDDRRIAPSFDLRLNTEAGNYEVIVEVTGEPGETETTLTSDPALPEPDIMALLVTGRTLDEMRGEEGDIAKEQVLSYLVGRVGSSLGRTLERATGLSEVRLDPTLIAHETDPGARLTLGQDLTDSLKLVYSTDLANSNDEVWVARYDVTRRFQTNATRQADGSYRFDFRHDVRAGGRPAPARVVRVKPLVTAIEVGGSSVLGEAESRRRLGLSVGQPYDYFSARDGLRNVEEALQDQGRLQSRARLDRRVEPEGVSLTLRITDGPLVEIRYDGASPPRRIDAEVRRQWNRGVFDSQRAGDAIDVLREWLIGEGHLSPALEHRVEELEPGTRRITFTITPGTHSSRILIRFDGAAGIEPGVLSDIIEDQDLERDLFTDPIVVTELLRRFYREEGYLATEIDLPRLEQEGGQATVVVPIDEGPRFLVKGVSVSGNTAIPAATILEAITLVAGDPFLPAAAQRSLDLVRDLYWRRAYNDVRTEYELVVDREAGTVVVTLRVREGRPSIVNEITIVGNDQTSDHLVAEQIELAPGDPLDLALLSRSRRNLYGTGAFSLVDLTREVETDAASASSTAAAEAATPLPVKVEVAVREVQPFEIRYGASFDTERGLGGIVDVANRNSLGKARVVGLTTRYDARLREARLYASQPTLLYWPVRTTASLYYREERNLQSTLTNPFEVDRLGLSFQQERELGDSYVWTYGYRFERARKSSTLLSSTQGQTIAVSPLTSTFTRETRDEMLDASQGSFTSHAFAYSPSWLGGDTTYVKYYGQYFRYFPLRPAVRKRFTGERLRPRLVYATGVRLGLSHGFGGAMPETERFYAGGSTTLRGFEQNTLGPIGPGGVPTGGNALLVLNNELRFPVIGLLDGVGFLDVGNVFGTVDDFSFADLRKTAGIGVRVRTPWFLVRGDYGIALDRRPGEPRGRFYFSIGQAF